MGWDLEYINGQTPLNEDEKIGLLIPTITNCEEVYELVQQNIEEAIHLVFSRSLKTETVLTEKFSCNLHKRMYVSVWAWAG